MKEPQPIVIDFVSLAEFRSLRQKLYRAKKKGPIAVERFIANTLSTPPAITFYGVFYLSVAYAYLGNLQEAKRYQDMIRSFNRTDDSGEVGDG